MFSFNKSAKKNLSPANIQLNLGKSPPHNKMPKSISPPKHIEYKKELNRAYSISPPKRSETNKPFTSHDLRQRINEYFNQKPSNKPTKLNLMKKTLFTKNKPVFLNLGVSPPHNEKSKSPPQKHIDHKAELNRAYSISPPKRRETNKPFTSHDIRESINDFYTQKPSNKPPKINLMKKLSLFTNNLKKTLFTKNKPVFLNLGQSPPSNNKQTHVQLNNIRKSIGGKKSSKKSYKIN